MHQNSRGRYQMGRGTKRVRSIGYQERWERRSSSKKEMIAFILLF
jgi:hypothetical protein